MGTLGEKCPGGATPIFPVLFNNNIGDPESLTNIFNKAQESSYLHITYYLFLIFLILDYAYA